MEIRKTLVRDLPRVLQIYEKARSFMRSTGNQSQWINGYPGRQLLESDIAKGNSYVCVEGDQIIGVFYYGFETEKTYLNIEGGTWLNENPYGVIHRIAVDSDKRGIAVQCIDWCYRKCGNLRIDTHRDNKPMRRVLEKCEFAYCGIIHLENGDERIAFQKS